MRDKSDRRIAVEEPVDTALEENYLFIEGIFQINRHSHWKDMCTQSPVIFQR